MSMKEKSVYIVFSGKIRYDRTDLKQGTAVPAEGWFD